MSSQYDYPPNTYRRDRFPPSRPPSQITSPPYPYYPGRPGSTTSTYAPAPTVVSVPRDIIYVQVPPPQPRNWLRDLTAPDPPKTPLTYMTPPSQQRQSQQTMFQPARYADGSQYYSQPSLGGPLSDSSRYADLTPAGALPSAPVQRSPALRNVFQEGQTHYETMGLQPHDPQQLIVKVGSLILERMQARINDPQSTEELKNVARATFINVAKAFGVLVDPVAREAYDTEIGLRPMYEEYCSPDDRDYYAPEETPAAHSPHQRERVPARDTFSPLQKRHTEKAWMPERNPYETLGVSPDATTADIENAFAGFEERFLQARDTMDGRHLALAQNKMIQRKKALKFLMHPKNRALYAKYLMYGSDASDDDDEDDHHSNEQLRQPGHTSDLYSGSDNGTDRHQYPSKRDLSSNQSPHERLQQVPDARLKDALPPPPNSIVSDASSTTVPDTTASRTGRQQGATPSRRSPSMVSTAGSPVATSKQPGQGESEARSAPILERSRTSRQGKFGRLQPTASTSYKMASAQTPDRTGERSEDTAADQPARRSLRKSGSRQIS